LLMLSQQWFQRCASFSGWPHSFVMAAS
jgi:hypothetical protein